MLKFDESGMQSFSNQIKEICFASLYRKNYITLDQYNELTKNAIVFIYSGSTAGEVYSKKNDLKKDGYYIKMIIDSE